MTFSTLNYVLKWFTELRETQCLLRDMIQDTDEQPDEEKHRGRSGRDLSAGSSIPTELGSVSLLEWMCSTIWKLSESHTIGIVWSPLQVDQCSSIISSISRPSTLSREIVGKGIENSKFLIMAWSFW